MADDSTARRGPLRAFRDWRRSRPSGAACCSSPPRWRCWSPRRPRA
ncbi:hypothetical protein ACFQXA_17110 [Nocardiopsis composta]